MNKKNITKELLPFLFKKYLDDNLIYKSNYISNKTKIFEIKNKNKIVKTIYKKRNKMRNSVLINQNFTEKNKMNFKNTFHNSTNKIESKYKKIFKNSLGYLSSKRMKKISNLFKENISLTRNNALDIKSYETTFVTPTTSEKQEMKLIKIMVQILFGQYI